MAVRYVLFEFYHDIDSTRHYPWFFSPSTQRSPHTFIMQPGDLVLILFDNHDLVYRFNTCCKMMQPTANEQLCMALYNANHMHRTVIAKHTLLADILMLPGLEHRWVVDTISNLTAMAKEVRVEHIVADQPTFDLSPPELPGHRSSLSDMTLPMTMGKIPSLWLKHPKLWKRAGGDATKKVDEEEEVINH